MEERKLVISAEEKYQEGMEFLNGIKGKEVDVRRVLQFFIEAAEEGHDEAEFRMGILYAFGEPNIMRNNKKAYECFKKSAESGIVESKFQLAECYMFGKGIEKNEELAIKYYEESSKEGHIMATKMLRDLYRNGIGVEKDINRALEYSAKTRGYGNNFDEITYWGLIAERNGQKYKKE